MLFRNYKNQRRVCCEFVDNQINIRNTVYINQRFGQALSGCFAFVVGLIQFHVITELPQNCY